MAKDGSVWGRGKLLAILGAAAATVVVLVVGLGFFAWQALDGGEPGDAAHGTETDTELVLPGGGPERRQLIAAAPMAEVADPLAYREGEIAAVPVETILIPAATRTGPVGVVTGFPQTPQGAVAQLAVIDAVVLQGMSVPGTHEVYRQWGTGTGQPEDWVMTTNVTGFLTSAGQSGQEKETGLVVTVTPAAGQVKGTDGDDWVLACVLLEIRAVLVEQAQVAYGHCEAMTWQGDRWLIDTTTQVAPAPSTWPGTDLAVEAGWRTWTTDH